MFLRVIVAILTIQAVLCAAHPFFGTLSINWYPEIKSQIDMVEYLKGNCSLMTTATVSFKRRDVGDVLEAIVGDVDKEKSYTLTQCLLDLFSIEKSHKIQLIFASAPDLNRVVELLMLKDDPRIWIHLDLVPLPGTVDETGEVLSELNEVLRWSKMVFSVGSRPIRGKITDSYTSTHAMDMKQITEQQKAMNLTTVFVMDGYVAQKQANFTELMKSLMPLERVSFLFRIEPDKEDKVIVKDLNGTLFAMGGKFRVYLDATQRLRNIVLNVPTASSFMDGNGNVFLPNNVSKGNYPTADCRPVVVRKYIRCAGMKLEWRVDVILHLLIGRLFCKS